MAHKVILPPKKNYIPQFLKQRDINSYLSFNFECLKGKDNKDLLISIKKYCIVFNIYDPTF